MAASAVAHAQRAAAIATAGLVPRRDLRQYYVFYRLASHQRRRYRPTDTFGGPTLVARAADEDHGDLGRDLGWSSFLRRSPTIVEVPGNHSSMILRPHVSTLAAELRRALDHGTAGA